MSMVSAGGRRSYCDGSGHEGAKVKGMVLLWPFRVVAAYMIFCSSRRGIKNVEVQPAPRMRMSTGAVADVEANEDERGGVNGVVSCVISCGGVDVCRRATRLVGGGSHLEEAVDRRRVKLRRPQDGMDSVRWGKWGSIFL